MMSLVIHCLPQASSSTGSLTRRCARPCLSQDTVLSLSSKEHRQSIGLSWLSAGQISHFTSYPHTRWKWRLWSGRWGFARRLTSTTVTFGHGSEWWKSPATWASCIFNTHATVHVHIYVFAKAYILMYIILVPFLSIVLSWSQKSIPIVFRWLHKIFCWLDMLT